MIAAAGYPRFLEGQHEKFTLDPVANLPLA
jgi:hypothetical protein